MIDFLHPPLHGQHVHRFRTVQADLSAKVLSFWKIFFSVFSFLAIVFLAGVLFLRFVYDFGIPWAVFVDEYLIFLLLANAVLLNRAFSRHGIQSETPWLWFLIGALAMNYVWRSSFRQHTDIDIFTFAFFFNYLSIGLGFFLLKKVRVAFVQLLRSFHIVGDDIESAQQREEAEETKRGKEFPHKFPALQRIPILRVGVRWMYKEGWVYSVSLFAIIVLFFVIVFVGGRISFPVGGDELHIFNTALGYTQSGEFQQWDWFTDSALRTYNRAREYSYFLSQVFQVFGASPLTARMPGLIAAATVIFLSYTLLKSLFKSKTLAIVFSFWLSTNTFFIFYATIVREYIFYILAVLLAYVIFFRSFDGEKKRIRPVFLIITTLILLFINLVLDKPNFFLAYPAFGIVVAFYFYRWYVAKWEKGIRRKTILTAVLLLFAGILFAIRSQYIHALAQGYLRPFAFSEQFTEVSFLNLPYAYFLAFLLLGGSLVGVTLLRNKAPIRFYRGLFYFFTIFVFSQFIIIFLLHSALGPHARYVAHLVLVNFLLVFGLGYIVLKIMGIQRERVIGGILLALAVVLNFSLISQESIQYNTWKRPNEYAMQRMFNQKTSEELGVYPPNHSQAASILAQYASPNTYLIDGGLSYYSYYYKDIGLPAENYYTFCFKTSAYKNLNYLCDEDGRVTLTHLQSFLDEHVEDTVLVTWLKRKEKSIRDDVVEGIMSLNFEKISGTGIDDSNIEMFVYSRANNQQL